MHGIRTSWKRSRISKFIVVIIPLPILLLSFLLGAVEVFAQSGSADDYFESEVINYDGEVHSIHWNVVELLDKYDQWINLDQVNGDYVIDYAPTSGNLVFRYRGLLSIRMSWSSDKFNDVAAGLGTLNNYISVVLDAPRPTYGSRYHFRTTVLDTEVLCSYDFDHSTHYSVMRDNEFQLGSVVRYRDYNFLTSPLYVDYNIEIECIQIISQVSETNLSNQIREMFVAAIPALSSISVSNSYKSLFVCDTSEFEYYNNIDKKLYNIWITDNLIYDQLRLNGASNNFANTVNNELIRDAAQAHSDSLDVQDKIMNDSTSFSSNQDILKNDIDIKQAAADTAVDGAVHQYTNDLDTVTDFQWNNFFTSQSGAATFWRDVGEYILNSSNLGFIATGLAIVTIITLFVFLLRL